MWKRFVIYELNFEMCFDLFPRGKNHQTNLVSQKQIAYLSYTPFLYM